MCKVKAFVKSFTAWLKREAEVEQNELVMEMIINKEARGTIVQDIFIDQGVYNRYQCFRILYSAKHKAF